MVCNKNLSISDILSIAKYMDENGLIGNNITININVDSKETLRKLNEDFYYRLNTVDENVDFDNDEFIVNVCGLKFRYRLANEDKT